MKSTCLFLLCFFFVALHTHGIPIQQDTRHDGSDGPSAADIAKMTKFVVFTVNATVLAAVVMAMAKPFVKVAMNVFTGNRLIESWWEQKAKYDRERMDAEMRYAHFVETVKQRGTVGNRREIGEGLGEYGPRGIPIYSRFK